MFKGILHYIVNSRPAWATWDSFKKKKGGWTVCQQRSWNLESRIYAEYINLSKLLSPVLSILMHKQGSRVHSAGLMKSVHGATGKDNGIPGSSMNVSFHLCPIQCAHLFRCCFFHEGFWEETKTYFNLEISSLTKSQSSKCTFRLLSSYLCCSSSWFLQLKNL